MISTRYQHDAQGQLSAISLPSGHWLHHTRNGQQQVTGLTLSPVQRPWLSTLAPERTIATDLRRDLAGPSHLQAGYGITTDWQRSHDASLARTLHRRTRNSTYPTTQTTAQASVPTPLGTLTKTQPGPNQLDRLLSRTASTQDFITLLLGLSPAQAAEPPKADAPTTTQAKTAANDKQADQQAGKQPGALSLPADPTALLDTRYLWSPQGWLLHTQRQGALLPNTAHPVERQTQAYNNAGQLLASVRSSGTTENANQETSVWRFAWQPRTQQRLLAQQVQGQSPQEELNQGTTASRFDAQVRLTSVRASEQTNTQGNGQINRQDHATQALTYNPNGQPEQIGTAQGPRRYSWDALGRLTQVRQGDQALARYAYDHRGLRTTKTVSGSGSANTTTHTLYNESRQPLAEVNAQGRITRQYIWLADMLLAVMDSDSGIAPASASNTADGQPLAQEVPLSQDLWAMLVSWGQVIGSAVTEQPWQLTFIHSNHLGAPELATNAQGQPVWAADYAPFGGATVRTFASGKASDKTGTGSAARTFTLHIRLPGQVWDEETRLHYNRQRYYDPSTGQYLTPDPLGQPDGPNAYLYAAGNPLTFIDPDGLVLFAFDGTGNSDNTSDPAMEGGSVSNVVLFRNLYQDSGTTPRYVSGVGTVHKDTEQNGGDIVPDEYAKGKLLDYLTGSDPLYMNDMGGNYSGPARIDRMMLYIRDESMSFYEQNKNDKAMDIDIVGFSRGAAEARDFANRITQASTTNNGKTYYRYKDDQGNTACQWVNFRFMGLWDSVLSTNFSGTSYALSIPSQFAYVAQAVALNEFRSNNVLSYGQRTPLPYSQHWGGFPLESIGASTDKPGATRIEMGFLGAHADIGGGFGDNELSKVALAWMLEQATTAGVKMNESPISIASTAVLHDKSNNIQSGKPVETCALCTGGEDRTVNSAVSGKTQRTMGLGSNSNSMTYADTHQFITYQDRNTLTRYTDADIWRPDVPSGIPGVMANMVDKLNADVTGTVNIDGYVAWLKLNGYDLKLLKVQ